MAGVRKTVVSTKKLPAPARKTIQKNKREAPRAIIRKTKSAAKV